MAGGEKQQHHRIGVDERIIVIYMAILKRVPEAQDGGEEDVSVPGVGTIGGRGPETPA